MTTLSTVPVPVTTRSVETTSTVVTTAVTTLTMLTLSSQWASQTGKTEEFANTVVPSRPEFDPYPVTTLKPSVSSTFSTPLLSSTTSSMASELTTRKWRTTTPLSNWRQSKARMEDKWSRRKTTLKRKELTKGGKLKEVLVTVPTLATRSIPGKVVTKTTSGLAKSIVVNVKVLIPSTPFPYAEIVIRPSIIDVSGGQQNEYSLPTSTTMTNFDTVLTSTDAELLTSSIDSDSTQAWSEMSESKKDEGCQKDMLVYIPLVMLCILTVLIIFATGLVLIFKSQRRIIWRTARIDSPNQSSYTAFNMSGFAAGPGRNCFAEFPQV